MLCLGLLFSDSNCVGDHRLTRGRYALEYFEEYTHLIRRRAELQEKIEEATRKVRLAVGQSKHASAAVEKAIRAWSSDDQLVKLAVQHFTHPRHRRKAKSAGRTRRANP